MHLELQEGAQPCHAKQPFTVPQACHKPTKKETDCLEKIGVSKKNNGSEWGAATFIQPKKTGDARVLTNFRKLNAALKRKPFPLPKTNEFLQWLAGFVFAAAIDLSMACCHVPLDKESQKLCSNVLPWGKCQHTRLPMGVKVAPDLFEQVVNNLFSDPNFVQACLDDILITSSDSFHDHSEKLDIVPHRLTEAGFRANLRKCFLAKDELDHLGHWFSHDGIQPQSKKVEAMLRLQPPKTVTMARFHP